jgi:hypothetical protein
MNSGTNSKIRTNSNQNLTVDNPIGSGITSINSMTGANQLINGSGAVSINSLSDTSTISIAEASAIASGIVNTTSQTFSGNKTFNGEVITNNLHSPNNTDLTIDAQGTGKIRLNTIQSQGLIIGTNSTVNQTDQIVISPDANLSRPSLIMGSINNGSTFTPFIGAQIPGVSWQTLYINNSGGGGVVYNPDIVQSPSVYNVATFKNVFVGNCNLHTGGTFSISGNTFVNSSRNITAPSLTSPSGSNLTINSSLNQDIIIDSLGTGKIRFNTVQQQGCIFGVDPLNTDNHILISPLGDVTRQSLVLGVNNASGNDLPYIGGQNTPGISWGTLCISPNASAYTMFGQNSFDGSAHNVFATDCNFKDNIKVGGTQFISSSRAITNCASLNTLTIPSGPGTLAKLSDIPNTASLIGCFKYDKVNNTFHGYNINSYGSLGLGQWVITFDIPSSNNDVFITGAIDDYNQYGFVSSRVTVQGTTTEIYTTIRNGVGNAADLGFSIILKCK